MPTGFIYVAATVRWDYQQRDTGCVPAVYGGKLYFGPCKWSMRPKMKPGDYVFGVSPAGTWPRRIVFAVRIEKRMTFLRAYERFPGLRGRGGQIHVQPASRPGLHFPYTHYEHTPGATHPEDWFNDIRTPEQDAFFVCHPGSAALDCWLGRGGPPISGEILEFLRGCSVHGRSGPLSATNVSATEQVPIKHGRLYTGLHLETNDPRRLMVLVSRSGVAVGQPGLPRPASSGGYKPRPRASLRRRGC
jgi:hypothetical protein